jgi:hypothetical protein
MTESTASNWTAKFGPWKVIILGKGPGVRAAWE